MEAGAAGVRRLPAEGAPPPHRVEAPPGRAPGCTGSCWTSSTIAARKSRRSTERTCLAIAVTLSAANPHDSVALQTAGAQHPALHSRRAPRRRRPGKLHGDRATPPTYGPSYAARASSRASPSRPIRTPRPLIDEEVELPDERVGDSSIPDAIGEIAIACSAGKDSMAMLARLAELVTRQGHRGRVVVLYNDLGVTDSGLSRSQRFRGRPARCAGPAGRGLGRRTGGQAGVGAGASLAAPGRPGQHGGRSRCSRPRLPTRLSRASPISAAGAAASSLAQATGPLRVRPVAGRRRPPTLPARWNARPAGHSAPEDVPEPRLEEHLSNPPARAGGDSGPMTIPDGTILALDDADVYVCQGGTHVPPHSSSRSISSSPPSTIGSATGRVVTRSTKTGER